MLDRRINKLKENLLRQVDEAPVVRHLVDANPRGDDMLGEVCRAAILLHPSSSFEQALTLARTMAYIVYIDDYLEEEHPELDLADYRRPDPATIPAMAKAAGLYMICTISKHKAERKGYADALMLDWRGQVAECTGANIFFIKDGKIHTPIADCFLDGITRRTVIDLAKRRGIEVIERRIMPEELSGFEECFISGTGAEVTPVSEAGPYKFTPGAMSRAMIDDYSAEVRPKQKAA